VARRWARSSSWIPDESQNTEALTSRPGRSESAAAAVAPSSSRRRQATLPGYAVYKGDGYQIILEPAAAQVRTDSTQAAAGQRATGFACFDGVVVAGADDQDTDDHLNRLIEARAPRPSTSASQAWICGRACTSAGLKITDSSSQIISMYFMALLRL
jgi:hypothetical protein